MPPALENGLASHLRPGNNSAELRISSIVRSVAGQPKLQETAQAAQLSKDRIARNELALGVDTNPLV